MSVRVPASLRDLGRRLLRLVGAGPRPATGADDPEAADAVRRAATAAGAGRLDEARTLYRYVLQRWPAHAPAHRGLRDAAWAIGDAAEAIAVQQRLVSLVSAAERAAESAWLAAAHHELGRRALAAGDPEGAVGELRAALRADGSFVPALVALGDAHEAAGDRREAIRAWERAAEAHPALPLLARLEHVLHEEGRPSRMIALYQAASERAPDNLALAMALGRVYFELEMLDEAAEVFEKLEVRAPDSPVVHAYLGAVFERRGDTREALEEYRRALRLGHAFDWPHECAACGAAAPAWRERCATCGRWNVMRPAAR
jgi:tetratricopeptide (TPR) repeat protein